MSATSVIEFSEGDAIVEAGAKDQRVFFLQQGRVELSGKSGVFATLGSGDFFGLDSALNGGAVDFTARAIEDGLVLPVTATQLQSMIQKHPEIATAMLARQAARLSAAQANPASSGKPKAAASKAKSAAGKKSAAKAEALVLTLAAGGDAYPLKPGKAYVVGRKDPASGTVPDIDFSELAEGHTVSRQHAVLECEKGQWQVRENKPTANGTYVNERRIAEGEAAPIKPGDTLVFGLIIMEVTD